MITTMPITDLDVEQLRLHVASGEFLDSFTDVFGNVQPAMTWQVGKVDLTAVSSNERVFMIRNNGGVTNGSDRFFYKERLMSISIFGAQGDSDSIIIQSFANTLEKWLVENYTDGKCLMSIQSQGVSGPYTTDDSREVFEISLSVKFNI